MITRAPAALKGCATTLLLLTAAVLALGCDKVALVAPSQSTITLAASSLIIPVNGTIEIVASVVEQAGTPVHNGTLVTFTSTVGTVEPREARTENGSVTVRLHAGAQSGTAAVTAISGPAKATIENIRIGGAAAEAIRLSANPQVVPSNGGSVELLATVVDASGNPLSGVPVTFTANAGSIGQSTVITDASGEARTTLTTNRETTVTANAGSRTATTTVRVNARPTITVTASPTSPVEDQPVTFTIAVTAPAGGGSVQDVSVNFGDGRRLSLGAFTGTTTLAHTYRARGTYTVTVTVVDSNGETTRHTSTIVVGEQGTVPVNVTVNSTTPSIAQPVQITVTATPPATAGTVTQYHYDFGDGVRVTLTSGTTTHAYATPGHKVITVSVETTTGATGEGRIEILVTDQP